MSTETWIVCKEEVFHFDGRKEVAYLWPSSFQEFDSYEQAHAFLESLRLPLGWVCKQVGKRSEDPDQKRMDLLESNPSLEIGFGDGDGETTRTVYKVTGYPNDREWHLLAEKPTLREALDEAITKVKK